MRGHRVWFMSSLLLVLSGCAYQPPYDPADSQSSFPEASEATASRLSTQSSSVQDEVPTIDVLRTGRYQLVTTQGTIGQRQLLEQAVRLNISPFDQATVGQAVQRVLLNTGFNLCQNQSVGVRQLLGNALPEIHHNMGPMTLRQALTMLIGDAWVLDADQQRRVVCFKPRNLIEDVTTSELGGASE